MSAASPTVQSLPPSRILESRSGDPDFKTVDSQFQGVGRTAAGGVRQFKVTNRAGVPGNAEAVFLNVAAVSPSGPGYLTVYPCGAGSPPTAANVNYEGGDVAANAVFAKVGTGGMVCIFTLAQTDLVVDVNGYTPAGAGTKSISPGRVLESRTGNPDFTTIDGQFEGTGRIAAGTVQQLKVTDRAGTGVPADAEAVYLNVVAVSPSGPGFLTVFPCGIAPPKAANVNYEGNDIGANAVFAKVDASGMVCIFTLAQTDLVVDVTGYTEAGAGTQSVAPRRALESRIGPGFTTADGKYQGIGRLTGGTTTAVKIRGRAGVSVPADAAAVFLNVAAVAPAAPGYLTVFPCGITPPLTANVNYDAGGVSANAVLARIGTLGEVCIFTWADVDLVIDVNGYTPPNPGVPIPPADDDYNYLYSSPSPQAPYTLNGQGYLGWNPCAPITYAINANGGATAAQRAVLDDAILQVEAASGFDFQYIGDATGSLDTNSIDANTPNGQAKAVFGFSNASLTPILSGAAIGIGGAGPGSGNNVTLINGKEYIVKGGYAIADMDDFSTTDELLHTFLHEIAHMVGLDHVVAQEEVMYFQLPSPPLTAFNTGDRNGLYNIGQPQCAGGSGALTRSATPSFTIDIAVVD